MTFPRPRWLTLALLVLPLLHAQSLLPPTELPLDTLSAFQPGATNWSVAGGVAGNPRLDRTLASVPGTGVLINQPSDTAHADLRTAWEHGDLELDLDFLVPPGAHPGILLQGRYWLDLSTGGRAPGLWQHLHLEFQAPLFDANGQKTRSARFVKIAFNDFVTGEDIEAAPRSPATAPADERLPGPLVFVGAGSPVAVRAIKYKRHDAGSRVSLEDLAYKLYAGEFRQIGDYDSTTPKSEGVPPSFTGDSVDKTGKFGLVFTATFVAPRAGAYAFTPDAQEPIRLLIDGQPAVTPLPQGGLPGVVNLTAGKHAFRLDFLHTSWRPPAFRLSVEGPGVALQMLTPQRPRTRNARSQQLIIEPAGRVRLQRGFVPFEPKKRLYAINVGTPAGIHYAYDFETGAILRVWRGPFLDTFEMWDGRGEPQLAKPAGSTVTFNAKPLIALLERSAHDWPDAPEPLASSQGYTLEPDGQPVFLSKLSTLNVRDRIAPAADGSGFTRTLNLSGSNTSWETWVLLAEADRIAPQPGGRGYVIGDRSYYIDLPEDSGVRPLVRTRNGRQQLVVAVPGNAIAKPIVYTLVW